MFVTQKSHVTLIDRKDKVSPARSALASLAWETFSRQHRHELWPTCSGEELNHSNKGTNVRVRILVSEMYWCLLARGIVFLLAKSHGWVWLVKSCIVEEVDMTYKCLFASTMYFKGRVTLFFANNYLTEYRITMEF